MGRARGQKRQAQPMRWPEELRDLQRRGGMAPDWHDTWHRSGAGDLDIPPVSPVNIDMLLGRPRMQWRYIDVFRKAGLGQVLEVELHHSFANIFEQVYPLQEPGTRQQLKSFLGGIRERRPYQDIDQEVRLGTLERVLDRLRDLPVDYGNPVEAGVVQAVSNKLQKARDELTKGLLSEELLEDMGAIIPVIPGTKGIRPRNKEALTSALSAAILLGRNYMHNSSYIDAIGQLSRFELAAGGSQQDPGTNEVNREAILPYWEIFRRACQNTS